MTNTYAHFAANFRDDVTFVQDKAGNVLSTYAELRENSARYANLLNTLGVKRGDRVSVQVEKSIEGLYLYFGCLRAGVTYLPLNTAYQPQEVQYFVDNARPSLSICDESTAAIYDSVRVNRIKHLTGPESLAEEMKLASPDHRVVDCTVDEIAVILYTSGTTGNPKGAMITHRNLIANAEVLSQTWLWQQDDVMLHALPIFHIHGLFVATHLPVLNSCPIILLPTFNPDVIIEQLPVATVYMGVPTNYVRLLANPAFNQQACRNMRLFTSGSAPLLPQTFTQFQTQTGHTIVERYGMTETGMNTSNPIDGERRAGTVGLPLRGVECRIVDDQLKPVALGVTGNLQVRGDNIFRGYWEMPEKTREDFTPDGFFNTGDLASVDEDGYVAIVGRDKDMVITGGLNVYPREIEAFIDDLPGVAESAVIGLPDADFGEAVTAVVVAEPGITLSATEIIKAVKANMANFKVPKQVFVVDALPRNTMGKVQKNVMRDQYQRSTP